MAQEAKLGLPRVPPIVAPHSGAGDGMVLAASQASTSFQLGAARVAPLRPVLAAAREVVRTAMPIAIVPRPWEMFCLAALAAGLLSSSALAQGLIATPLNPPPPITAHQLAPASGYVGQPYLAPQPGVSGQAYTAPPPANTGQSYATPPAGASGQPYQPYAAAPPTIYGQPYQPYGAPPPSTSGQPYQPYATPPPAGFAQPNVIVPSGEAQGQPSDNQGNAPPPYSARSDTAPSDSALPATGQPGAAQPGTALPDTNWPGAASPSAALPDVGAPDATRSGAAPPKPPAAPSKFTSAPQVPTLWQPQSTAVLQLLDKVDAQSATLTITAGQSAKYGALTVAVRACNVSAPDGKPDATAFLDISDSHPDLPTFHGWMLKSDPSVSMLQHPIFDVRVLGCRP